MGRIATNCIKDEFGTPVAYICCECRETKELTKEHFYVDRSNTLTGFARRCKVCTKLRWAEWREKHTPKTMKRVPVIMAPEVWEKYRNHLALSGRSMSGWLNEAAKMLFQQETVLLTAKAKQLSLTMNEIEEELAGRAVPSAFTGHSKEEVAGKEEGEGRDEVTHSILVGETPQNVAAATHPSVTAEIGEEAPIRKDMLAGEVDDPPRGSTADFRQRWMGKPQNPYDPTAAPKLKRD